MAPGELRRLLHEPPDPQLFQPRQIAATTLAGMIDSTEVHARVGARATPPLPAAAVAGMVRITPERNSDILNVAISSADRERAVALANAYAGEAVRFTQQLQAQETAEASRYLEQQVARVRDEISAAEEKLRAMPLSARQAAAAPRPAALLTRLDDARDQLLDLLGRYTDAHPLVQEQRARIAVLEEQVAGLGNQPATTSTDAPPDGSPEVSRDVLKTLENQRLALVGRLRLAQMLERTPPGYYRIFAPATPEHAMIAHPTTKIGLLSLLGALAGAVAAAGVAAGVEIFDRRLKTTGDVRRVTQLPVLATLDRFDRMPPEERAGWAFRTWTALQNCLSESPNKGLVCGFTSSRRGEGRSLWVQTMAEAANRCGFRVLTITTQPSPAGEELKQVGGRDAAPPYQPVPEGQGAALATNPPASPPGLPVVINGKPAALAANVLASPAEITQRLTAQDSPPLVHIPLPGWVWNLERRKEWMEALRHWSSLENVVILVELPPASAPEAVLLAQNLPNLVWLADSTRACAPETCAQLQTLRHARCNIVGAMVNRTNGSAPLDRFARWAPGCATVLLFALGAPVDGMAQPDESAARTQPAASSASLSISSPAQRAGWQEHLTLGPGDVLRLALYGEPELTREDAAIQPDGRISYLEAQDITAAGLTVDEFRAKLDEELGRFRRAPRAMVAPVEFRSKKYYMLGKVAQKGVFTLDRPLTAVEAVARAHGFETGLSGRNIVELVDLSRSFLVRKGRRAAVDFEKLFATGDLAQNIPVEPGDYFYFPPADLQEVHLLGEVQMPGPVSFTEGLTATRAIASRGGFTRRAWRQRVLVVRGSLGDPKTIAVAAAEVLGGRLADVKLQPRDIVYVSARPWIRAEELLDDAISAFAQSVVVFWTTDKVIPVVR